MKIEKRIYRIFYKGKQFLLPIFVLSGVEGREDILVRKKVVAVTPVKSR